MRFSLALCALFFNGLSMPSAERPARPAERNGAPGHPRKTGSILRARFPGDSPSVEAGPASPARNRTAWQRKQYFPFLYKPPLRGVGCSPRGDASWHAVGRHASLRRPAGNTPLP